MLRFTFVTREVISAHSSASSKKYLKCFWILKSILPKALSVISKALSNESLKFSSQTLLETHMVNLKHYEDAPTVLLRKDNVALSLIVQVESVTIKHTRTLWELMWTCPLPTYLKIKGFFCTCLSIQVTKQNAKMVGHASMPGSERHLCSASRVPKACMAAGKETIRQRGGWPGGLNNKTEELGVVR